MQEELRILRFGCAALGVIAVMLAICLALAGQVIGSQQEINDALRARILAAERTVPTVVEVIPEPEVEPQAFTDAATAWPEIETPWNTIINCTVTAYCPCDRCCGKWADGITASGAPAEQGKTVAVDTSKIPLGADVRIDGDDTVYVAQDTGVAGSHIDLYFDDHTEALAWGLQNKTVYWRMP